MRLSNKSYILAALLLALNLVSGASDTLKIDLTYKYKLDSAGHTSGRTVVHQKLHTADGRLFREISFNEATSQITGYVFYFYRDDRLFTREFYDQQDSLSYILKNDYDAAGNNTVITKLIPGASGWITVEKTTKEFNNKRELVQEIVYYGKKAGATTQYLYSAAGLLLQESSRFKPFSRSVNKQVTRQYSYSPDNKIALIQVSGKDNQGNPFGYSEEYGYDNSGRLTQVKTIGSGNETKGRREYSYLVGNVVGLYKEYNAKGILSLVLEYEYKKHFMEPGTQVSRYEDF
jgi:hypothetical protein